MLRARNDTYGAGVTDYPVGTQVMITGITDPHDTDLNGRTGRLTQPHVKYPIQDVGVVLDPDGMMPKLDYINVYATEFEVI